MTYPVLGSFLPELRIPNDARIRSEKTRGRGHYTIWADADALLWYTTHVVPVTGD